MKVMSLKKQINQGFSQFLAFRLGVEQIKKLYYDIRYFFISIDDGLIGCPQFVLRSDGGSNAAVSWLATATDEWNSNKSDAFRCS